MHPLGVERSTLDVGCSAPLALLVISPEAEDPREHATLTELFLAGLTSYHLRKPTWSRDQLAAWLHAVPAKFHPRIVLHTHHDLATEFTLGGLHDREEPNPKCHLIGDTFRSRAVHDLPTLRASLDTYDRLLVSPLFPSFSKPGHAPDARLAPSELKSVLALPHRAEVIALGGIDASRISACGDLGFDGVAVLGAIWQAADPVSAFGELQTALHAHAA